MNDLKDDILKNMQQSLSSEQFDNLNIILDSLLNDYNIEKKSRELVVVDNSNTVMLKNFLGMKILEGRSNRTIEYYKLILSNFLRDINKDVLEITTNDIRQYLARYKIERGVSTTTLNNMRRVFCSFFKFLTTEGIIIDNPMNRITSFKQHKKQVEPLTSKEFEVLWDACTNTRDRALIEFLYSTGVRVTECSNLNINDIDLKQGTVSIKHGKGDKDRIAYISEKASYWLEKYLNERKDNNECLWYGRKGRLTKSGIEAMVRRLSLKTGIPAHPHKFRHTLASNLIKRNAPIHTVQKILGHEDINTTMIYVSVDDSEVQNIHSKLMI